MDMGVEGLGSVVASVATAACSVEVTVGSSSGAGVDVRGSVNISAATVLDSGDIPVVGDCTPARSFFSSIVGSDGFTTSTVSDEPFLAPEPIRSSTRTNAKRTMTIGAVNAPKTSQAGPSAPQLLAILRHG